MKFFYVYILQSQSAPEHFYVGLTEDLQSRLKKHNAGEVPYTSNFCP
jgi:predicted GIY-YIG superfamily endonuclease